MKNLSAFYWIALFLGLSHINTAAQSLSPGVHLGMTLTRMLWADKADDNSSFFIQYPDTQFKPSWALGISADLKLSDKFYIPAQLDFYSKRFSVSTGGVVHYSDEEGQWLAIRTDYLDYSINQVALSAGGGYNVTKHLAVEIQPYVHLSIGKEKIKIADVIKWHEDPNFQQDFDFGISGYLRANVKNVYVKAGYQFGVRKITEYSVFDAVGSPLGKFPIRNTMVLLIAGYRF